MTSAAPGGNEGPPASGLARFARGEAVRPADPAPELPAALQRFLSPRAPRVLGETCEMCGVAVPEDDHRHVVDLQVRSLMCVCRGCALLFLERGAAQGRYLSVPERYLRVQPVELDSPTWASLQIPVGIVFVVRGGAQDDSQDPVAFYPSPGGATESELPMQSWARILADNPVLAEVEPDTEAVLIRTDTGSEPECYVVPVDRCYELVGTLRLQWRGFDGGQEARQAIAAFFEQIDHRSKVVAGHVVAGHVS